MNLSLELAGIVADRRRRSTMSARNSFDQQSDALTQPVVLYPRITSTQLMRARAHRIGNAI